MYTVFSFSGDISVLLRDTPAGNTSLPGAPLASPSIGFDIQRVLNVSKLNSILYFLFPECWV